MAARPAVQSRIAGVDPRRPQGTRPRARRPGAAAHGSAGPACTSTPSRKGGGWWRLVLVVVGLGWQPRASRLCTCCRMHLGCLPVASPRQPCRGRACRAPAWDVPASWLRFASGLALPRCGLSAQRPACAATQTHARGPLCSLEEASWARRGGSELVWPAVAALCEHSRWRLRETLFHTTRTHN